MIEWVEGPGRLGQDEIQTYSAQAADDVACPAGCIAKDKTGPLATAGWGLVVLGGAALVGIGFGIKAVVV